MTRTEQAQEIFVSICASMPPFRLCLRLFGPFRRTIEHILQALCRGVFQKINAFEFRKGQILAFSPEILAFSGISSIGLRLGLAAALSVVPFFLRRLRDLDRAGCSVRTATYVQTICRRKTK